MPAAVALSADEVEFWPEAPEGELRVLDAALRLATLLACWRADGFLSHGAGLARGDVGVAVIAPSGGGKSTLTNLATDFTPLSDETVGLFAAAPSPTLLGTVFRSSSPRTPEPRRVRLGAILLLKKSATPSFRRADPRAVISTVHAEAYRSPTPLLGKPIFSRIAAVVRAVPSFVFSFPKDDRAQELLHRLFDDELRNQSP